MLVERLLEVRKHAGMMVPAPVQAVLTATLARRRRTSPTSASATARGATSSLDALRGAGFRIDHSEAGLYLWATRDEPCWDTVAGLAERGVLVAPGDFYGPAGARHVRVALTATDERIAQLAARL